MDEFEKYKKSDGSIDWGAYSLAKFESELTENKEKKIPEVVFLYYARGSLKETEFWV